MMGSAAAITIGVRPIIHLLESGLKPRRHSSPASRRRKPGHAANLPEPGDPSMSTRAPDAAPLDDDQPPTAAQPVLDSMQLRKIAEAVSGYRGTPRYWLVLTRGADGSLAYEIAPEDPGYRPDAVVIPCQTPKEADRPRVVSATIRGEGGPEVDLLDLQLEDDEGDVVYRADAVFWGESSVEKFVVPYYASVYGAEAGAAVTELLDTYNGVTADGQAQVREGETNVTEAYGLVHIPRSEYIELDDPAGGRVRTSRHQRFAVLAVDRRTGTHRVVTVEEYRKRRGGG
jgi:hypothetical protein